MTMFLHTAMFKNTIWCEDEERKKGNMKNLPGFVRLSFGLYNTYEEIDKMVKMLSKIINNKEHYIKEYPLDS